jgi:3-dehydroquinate synthase
MPTSGITSQKSDSLRVTGYEILVSPGALDQVASLAAAAAPAHSFAIIADENVAALYGHRVSSGFEPGTARLFTFPAGEAHKTRREWGRLTDSLLSAGYGRDTTIIALGGGVTGDLAGFVAATFLRGVPYVQVPTSLLAMVDSSVGAKTGVDTSFGKNLVGAFHRPAAVIADPRVLATLPLPHIRSGLAEAIKHGVIASEPLFAWIASNTSALLADPTGAEMLQLLPEAIGIKARVVETDERESGLRKILNFGHTIGHAVELASGYSLLHGEAVAIGMAVEARIAEISGIASPGLASAIESALSGAFLPVSLPDGLDPATILAATRTDKKSRAGEVRYSLPCRIGEMAGASSGYSLAVSDDIVIQALSAVKK